jgi:hypothetical protein
VKPKIQMRIGFWGVTTFFVLWFCAFIFDPPASHVTRLSMITSLAVFAYYIGGISEKKITTTRTAFRIWWILYGVAMLGILFLEVLGGSDFQSVLIIFLPLALSFGFMTLIMWMGLRGLERIIEAENELDKSPVSSTTLKTDEPKWPGIVLLIILLVIAGFIPQNAWWGRILFYILMALVVACLCTIFPFMRKLIFGKSNRL